MNIFSILDVETTGFNFNGGDRIVEIGIVKIDEDGSFIEGFETIINPEQDVGPVAVHGITNEMVIDAPKFSEIIFDIFEFLKNSYVAAHNADFDFPFINSELKRIGLASITGGFCTLKIARKLLPDLPSRSLKYLTQHFNIKNNLLHSAYSDAFSTAQLLKIFMTQYKYKIDFDLLKAVENPITNSKDFSSSRKKSRSLLN
ncbi:MAG: 3'-5' exonuclease [Spirochaetaceae bacterium]|nr:3'-5' exonuclease [Spirochaetaceae bacterium]